MTRISHKCKAEEPGASGPVHPPQGSPGLTFPRRWTRPGEDVFSTVPWERRDCRMVNGQGAVLFEARFSAGLEAEPARGGGAPSASAYAEVNAGAGRYGQGLDLTARGAFVAWLAPGNIDLDQGTLRFWFRPAAWPTATTGSPSRPPGSATTTSGTTMRPAATAPSWSR